MAEENERPQPRRVTLPDWEAQGIGNFTVFESEPGRPLATRADRRIRISQQLMDSADPQWMRVGEGLVRITLANGTWVYRLDAQDERAIWTATLIKGDPIP